MSSRNKALLGAVIGAGMLAISATSASAYIACSGRVCWHRHDRYDYSRHARIVIHEDNWRWHPRERYSFREHEGRGYWRGGRWIGW